MKKIIWTRHTAALSAAAAAALWLHGCGPGRPHPNAPVEESVASLSPECDQANEIELLLADLVPLAGSAFGSVSPFIYEVQEGGTVSFSSNAVVRDEPALRKAREALARVNDNREAQKAFRENVERSQTACRGTCPLDAAYEIRETEHLAPDPDGFESFQYSVGGEPSAAEKEAFLGLMTVSAPSCPPVAIASFDGNVLFLKRKPKPRPPRDCHAAAADGHLDRPTVCSTETVPTGTWRLDDSDHAHPRHCCVSH